MKLIRMLKTMAGPKGTYVAGSTTTVGEREAAALVGANAAEIVADITLRPPETTAIDGAPERTVQRKSAPRKRAKKSTKAAE